MKKGVCLLLILSWMLSAFCACSSAKASENSQQAAEVYDVDLTEMSQLMRYSEVNYILANPQEFLGKTIKIEGYFYIYEADIRNVYVCIVPDSTACCTAGLEFRLAGEHRYPEDYPPSDAEITVVGTFAAYSDDEGETVCYQLEDARIL